MLLVTMAQTYDCLKLKCNYSFVGYIISVIRHILEVARYSENMKVSKQKCVSSALELVLCYTFLTDGGVFLLTGIFHPVPSIPVLTLKHSLCHLICSNLLFLKSRCYA